MDFALSEERRMLVETLERYLRDRYPIETRHAASASENGYSREVWEALAELGAVGAMFPADAGGFGGEGEDISLVFEELGKALTVEPFLANLLGGTALALAGGQQGLLDNVIAGVTTVTLAHGEPASRYALHHVETRAEGGRLTGRKAVVPNGDSADHIVVSARVSGDVDAPEGLGLYLVEAGAEGLSRRGYATVDGGRAAEITLENTPATPLGEPGQAGDLIERIVARGVLAASAEAVGLMQVCCDTTLEYLKTRKQFGRSIGGFQALQHRMVEMVMELEQTRSAVMLAAASLDAERADRERALSAAKNLAGRAGRMIAEEAIQLHGGIAMTWEYPLPHFAKRLVMIDHLFGDTDHHLERFRNFA